MLAAVATSSLFLISYLYYHWHVGSVRFQGHGLSRPVYFTILISHMILAATIVPLVVITLSRALRERFDKHRAIARWTYPLWLYVSVTGVVIYFMLYHLFAA
jgi:putative membrane protein